MDTSINQCSQYKLGNDLNDRQGIENYKVAKRPIKQRDTLKMLTSNCKRTRRSNDCYAPLFKLREHEANKKTFYWKEDVQMGRKSTPNIDFTSLTDIATKEKKKIAFRNRDKDQSAAPDGIECR